MATQERIQVIGLKTTPDEALHLLKGMFNGKRSMREYLGREYKKKIRKLEKNRDITEQQLPAPHPSQSQDHQRQNQS